MKKITMQQDANDKIKIEVTEDSILLNLKKFFKWRKDISLDRFNKLGTKDHDRFIKYLHTTTQP